MKRTIFTFHVLIFLLINTFSVHAKQQRIKSVVVEVYPSFCFSSAIFLFPDERKLMFYKAANWNYHIGHLRKDTTKVYDDIKDYKVCSFYKIKKKELNSITQFIKSFSENDFIKKGNFVITSSGDTLITSVDDGTSIDIHIFYDDNSFKKIEIDNFAYNKQCTLARKILDLCEKYETNIYKKMYFNIINPSGRNSITNSESEVYKSKH